MDYTFDYNGGQAFQMEEAQPCASEDGDQSHSRSSLPRNIGASFESWSSNDPQNRSAQPINSPSLSANSDPGASQSSHIEEQARLTVNLPLSRTNDNLFSSSHSAEGDSLRDDISLKEEEGNNDNIIFQEGLGLVLPGQQQANIVEANRNARTTSAISLVAEHNWQSNKHSIKSRLFYLLSSGALSDITFIIGGDTPMTASMTSSVRPPEKFKAHKFVLSMSSAVFDAMFNGHMATSDDVVEIPDVEPAAFSALLTFLYTDEINVDSDTVMSVLYAAKKYSIPAIEQECVEFLKDNINSDNAFMLLTQARLFDEPVLAKMCLDCIDKSTNEAIASEGFTEIDNETLCSVLSRETLGIRESKLFTAATKWAEHACLRQNLEITAENQRKMLGEAIKLIRYPLMTVEEFAVQVAQSKILNDSELVELFLYFTVNPKPKISFNESPRYHLSGKEQVVSRFCQIGRRWGYSGTCDRIKFLVTKKIYIAGFGLYGSIHGPAEYTATIEILTDSLHVLSSTDSSFSCDGSTSTFRVMFNEPVEVLPCVHYIGSVTVRGPDSYFGCKGLRKVTHESVTSGKISFQFSYAAGNNNGTSVEDGQIAEIIFYT